VQDEGGRVRGLIGGVKSCGQHVVVAVVGEGEYKYFLLIVGVDRTALC
jgi:hypothetical protein